MRKAVAFERLVSKGFGVELECGHVILLRTRLKYHPIMRCTSCPRQWTETLTGCAKCGSSERTHVGNGLCFLCARPGGDYSDFSQNRRFKVNDRFFDGWNELSAYVYGVLFADGWVSRRRSSRVAIAVSDKDEAWLLQIKAALECESPLSRHEIRDQWSPRTAVKFGFNSRRIHRRLRELGIKERPPVLPDAVAHHFVRGFFDGDGSIYPSGYGTMNSNFVGPEWMLDWLVGVLSSAGIPRVKAHRKTNSDKVMSIRYAAASTELLGRFMYRGATLWLPRKRDRFMKGAQ